MIKLRLLVCCLICIYSLCAQENNSAIKMAFQVFEKDPQLKYAIASIAVADAQTGKIIFEKNAHYGLVPASSLKIFTAAAALELLGSSYRYKTSFYLHSKTGSETGIIVSGTGDPTFGASRYLSTTKKAIVDALRKKLQHENISSFNGQWFTSSFYPSQIPRKWIWEDIGNYYGAPWSLLNWNENQYTIWLSPGKQKGDAVEILSLEPVMNLPINNELTSGTALSGDNAYIYFNPDAKGITIKGTVPCCRDRFPVHGAVPAPEKFALQELSNALGGTIGENAFATMKPVKETELIYEHLSPQLDSIIYWFMQKSINLYGEALLQTISAQSRESGEEPVAVLKKFWQQKGIDSNALAIVDGSGLSPANRVTTGAMARALFYAGKQKWFADYLKAFPLSNGMKIKSGTIGGVRAYAGYIDNRSGKKYCFSFIVNNYNGSVTALTKKMFDVLNVLKD